MKFFITLALLSYMTVSFAQNTKIDENEKKRLERQYKALESFYIDDDGLVVYSKSNKNNSSDRAVENQPYSATEETEAPIVNRRDEVEEPPTWRPLENHSTYSNGNNIPYVRKEASALTDYNQEESITEVPHELPSYNNSYVHKEEKPTYRVPKKKEAELVEVKNRRSIFEKKPSKYKSMEEAALAVESLLESLKKEQSTSNTGSMSSRLSYGAGKATLRSKSSSSQSSGSYSPQSRNTTTSSTSANFGDEPTYFINGQMVEKEEVNKLRKSDIISREIRAKNTATGNPNGEIWYEVRVGEN